MTPQDHDISAAGWWFYCDLCSAVAHSPVRLFEHAWLDAHDAGWRKLLITHKLHGCPECVKKREVKA